MPRYAIITNWYENDGPLLPALSVDGPSQCDTGLIDRHGNKIVRLPNTIGFQAKMES